MALCPCSQGGISPVPPRPPCHLLRFCLPVNRSYSPSRHGPLRLSVDGSSSPSVFGARSSAARVLLRLRGSGRRGSGECHSPLAAGGQEEQSWTSAVTVCGQSCPKYGFNTDPECVTFSGTHLGKK